jgi:hypothetical protein
MKCGGFPARTGGALFHRNIDETARAPRINQEALKREGLMSRTAGRIDPVRRRSPAETSTDRAKRRPQPLRDEYQGRGRGRHAPRHLALQREPFARGRFA